MYKKRRLLILFTALLAFSIPLFAIVSGQSLTNILKDLWTEMQLGYAQRSEAQERFVKDYEDQHKKLMDIITNSNERSILLYTQEQNMTFDLTYALKKVTSDYKNFNKDIKPYEHIVHSLDNEIDRYARLIEALRRLPPMMKEIEVEILPDSLMYHNDSLDLYFSSTASALEKEVIRIAVKDTASSPIILDAEGEIYRDSGIRYASSILKLYAENRAMVQEDSTHYQEAYLRIKETYDYAQSKYQELEEYVFKEGQTPFLEIMASPRDYWAKVVSDLRAQYDFREIEKAQAADSSKVNTKNSGKTAEEDDDKFWEKLSSKGANSTLVIICGVQLVALAFFWILTYLILLLLSRIFKKRRFIPREQLSVFSILIGTIIYFLVLGFVKHRIEYVQLSATHINIFLWLLIAFFGSLLLRVKPERMRHCIRLYIPTFLIAMMIIACRITFVPDSLMIFFFPPILYLSRSSSSS